jgi:hypothetical protein
MSPLAGRFLGRDPIGYVDGWTLYPVFFTLIATDPHGEQVGSIKTNYFNRHEGDCGKESKIQMRFRLPAGHKAKGYLIQKVTVHCAISTCTDWIEDSLCGPIPHCGCRNYEKHSFSYFEAWRVGFNSTQPTNPPGWGATAWDDYASFTVPDRTCGQYKQEGELRFYSDADTGDIANDPKWSPKPLPFRFGQETGSCATGAGDLYSIDGKGGDPAFWSMKTPIAEGNRAVPLDWYCCDCKGTKPRKKKFVDFPGVK